jgi:hypothetical protein
MAEPWPPPTGTAARITNHASASDEVHGLVPENHARKDDGREHDQVVAGPLRWLDAMSLATAAGASR